MEILFCLCEVVSSKVEYVTSIFLYLWGVGEGEKSWKVQDFALMTPDVSSIIDNNMRSSCKLNNNAVLFIDVHIE